MAVANGNRKWSGSETLWREFTAIDLATVAYIAVATGAVLLSFRGEGIPGWPWVLTAHGLIVVLVLLAPRARRSGRVGRFIGDWYPMLLLPALYGEIGVLTLSAGFQNDQLIQRLETWVFGSQISYRWIRESPNATLSFILHSCYLAYYPILYASPFALWIVGRRDAAYGEAAKRAVEVGLGVNAGHDLNLANLPTFLAEVAGVAEVSIGHAL